MLESKFKSKQREDFMALGWVFVQIGNDAPTGFPDTLCLAPNGYACYVEWKKSVKAEHQPLQDYWINKLNNMGHDAQFVFPEDVDAWREYVLQKGAK